jgi:tripartite-type tricarboxylate transporter receptor subunit TctC
MNRAIVPSIIAVVTLAISTWAPAARGESAQDFFRGKQISLIIGYNPGGSYDAYGRLTANFLPRFIPGNPSVVPKNMPGVGSVKAANFLAGQASRDGLTLGIIGQALALTQALGSPSVEYDMRAFNWIGRFTSAVELTEVWHTSPVKTIEDAMKRDTILAATSAGSTTDFYPRLMNRVAGTRFKIVKGYPGTSGSVLAMERGETEGSLDAVDALLFIRPDWLREKKVSVLVQYAQGRHPALPDVPALVEFGKTPEDKQALALFASAAAVGRALMAPPGIPAERVAVLRRAFSAMVADPAFREQVEKSKIELDPLPGEAMQKMMADTLNVPASVFARAKELNKE